MFKPLAAALVLALMLSSGDALSSPPMFQGTARPIDPPTRCADVLPAPTRDDQGGYHYGSVYAAKPLRIASCWKGTLKGSPFVLTGYSSAEGDTAVVVQYAGHTMPLALGTNGSPTVIGFTGAAVCFVPNPAKGFLVVVDMLHGDLLQGRDLARRCQLDRIEAALSSNRRVDVAGLKMRCPIGYGVIRTY